MGPVSRLAGFRTESPDLIVILSPPPDGAEWIHGIFVLTHLETFVLFPELATTKGRPNASAGPRFFLTERRGDPQAAVRVIADPSIES
jgi:hypothetical protein